MSDGLTFQHSCQWAALPRNRPGPNQDTIHPHLGEGRQ